MQQVTFNGELYKSPMGGVFIDFPFDTKEAFGKGGIVRVKAWFDGQFYRLSLLPRKNGMHYFHLRKEIREALGKTEGDGVQVKVEPDHDPPALILPDYLQWLLDDDSEMNEIFRQLSWSMKKQLVEYVEQPKTDEAKVHRVNRFFEFLRNRRLKPGNSTFNPDEET